MMSIEDKLFLDKFNPDKESHLEVDQEACERCDHRVCTLVCPAKTYAWEEDHLVVSFENCLECGSCRLLCSEITWRYPRGGFGVSYRFG